MTTRQEALSNPSSTYYLNVSQIIRRAMVDAEHAEASRRRVMIPFKVEPTSVAEYERRFGWKIVVENHGLRSAHTPHVAGLAYCMALRNMVSMGFDGEEVIAVDADLPLVVAKGAAYVKVVRTSTSNKLIASYAMEETQLDRLVRSGNTTVKGAAAAMVDELKAGGGNRVFLSPLDANIRGDTILLDHTRTSISLVQAVACAHAWRATMIRGVCFFQVEMLFENSGPLAAFPGMYYIDEESDIITYVPESDPETSFSHSWSALKSFFLNHECVYDGKTWVVEKHLGEQGVVHYVANCAEEPWEFPSELGANYYTDDLMEWVDVEFPTRGGAAEGAASVYWRRDKVRMLKSLYDKTVATMMQVEEKRLTRDGVLSVLRAFNNTTVLAGDTVRRPYRVYSDSLSRVATPILAHVVCRRANASLECSHALSEIRRRYNIVNESVLSLFWEMCCSVAGYSGSLSVGLALGNAPADLSKLVDGTVDLSVVAKEVPSSIVVTHLAGAHVFRDCGPMVPGLPGQKPSFLLEMLGRARRFMSTKKFEFDVRKCEANASSSASEVEVDSEWFDCPESSCSDSTGGCGIPVVEHEKVEFVDVAEREGITRKLFDKLVAEQDAADFLRPPKLVNTYESVTQLMPSVRRTVLYDTACAQEDYDDGFPGISLSDPAIVPHVASVEDTDLVRDAYMSINESKREAAAPRWIRRAKGRGGAAGKLPRTQIGTIAALGKRNADVPMNRVSVDFDTAPAKAVDSIRRVCYRKDWRDRLNVALSTGLWQPNTDDLNVYVGKVDTSKAEAMLREYFNIADVNMKRWMVMVKERAKPPLDVGADTKVALPQTIMYNESKGMNAMYSSIMSRFHDVMDELLLPNVKFNDRASPAEHEVWFNTLQPLRVTSNVHRYQGDSFNFDRSQELVAFSVELQFYREHGLNEETLNMWKQTMGVKTAVSLMHGILMHIVMQGLSGIFKTLFRNGLVTLASVVSAAKLQRDQLISLDVKGDDYTIETNVPIDVEHAIRELAWGYNLSAKLWGCEYLYFCSKYWVFVDGWWYWVADPERKWESICEPVMVDDRGEDKLSEKWISFRDDLRNYGRGDVADELAKAVQVSTGRHSRPPVMLIGGLAQLAESKDEFMKFYGPSHVLGV